MRVVLIPKDVLLSLELYPLRIDVVVYICAVRSVLWVWPFGRDKCVVLLSIPAEPKPHMPKGFEPVSQPTAPLNILEMHS